MDPLHREAGDGVDRDPAGLDDLRRVDDLHVIELETADRAALRGVDLDPLLGTVDHDPAALVVGAVRGAAMCLGARPADPNVRAGLDEDPAIRLHGAGDPDHAATVADRDRRGRRAVDIADQQVRARAGWEADHRPRLEALERGIGSVDRVLGRTDDERAGARRLYGLDWMGRAPDSHDPRGRPEGGDDGEGSRRAPHGATATIRSDQGWSRSGCVEAARCRGQRSRPVRPDHRLRPRWCCSRAPARESLDVKTIPRLESSLR